MALDRNRTDTLMQKGQELANDTLFSDILYDISRTSRLKSERDYIQHGVTSCLLHSIAVAYYSDRLALRFNNVFCNRRALIRGALLHDYFLYDWHISDPSHRLHGFKHPKTALSNAKTDFSISPIEEDIIKKHMFPLTPAIPKYREAYLVSAVDKALSVYEIFSSQPYQKSRVEDYLDNI